MSGTIHHGSTSKSACEAIPAPQVDDQLESTRFALDGLENTVTTLINRLTVVTGDYPEEPLAGCAPSPPLVPIAASISYAKERIRNVEARLSRALANLQI